MQRKPSFSYSNCGIKMPDGMANTESLIDEEEPIHRRQQLINFGHAQWGFNNWSWSVTKQDLDFVEITNGKYTAGVVAFVSVELKTVDIHRLNIGYATSIGPNKGSAIYRARKCAVTNALRETLLSFGGSIATELTELLDAPKPDIPAPENPKENNINVPNNLPNHLANNPVKNLEHKEPKIANVPAHPNNFGQPTKEPYNNHKDAGHPPMHHKEPNHHLVNPYPMSKEGPPYQMSKEGPPYQMSKEGPPHPMSKEGHQQKECRAASARMPLPLPPPGPRAPRNEVILAGMSEEEARAERKRRQRQAQEEFRLKHLTKNNVDEKPESNEISSLDTFLMDLQTQDMVLEVTSNTVDGKRKSPVIETGNNKRLSVVNK